MTDRAPLTMTEYAAAIENGLDPHLLLAAQVLLDAIRFKVPT